MANVQEFNLSSGSARWHVRGIYVAVEVGVVSIGRGSARSRVLMFL